MKRQPFLLDTSVLLALSFPEHLHHQNAQSWFRRYAARHGFRTCPITECGFVRIASNASFTNPPLTVREALHLLDQIRALPHYDFWPDHQPVTQAFAPSTRALLRHRHITDAYLLSLAISYGGRLATLDRGIASLPGASEHTVAWIRG